MWTRTTGPVVIPVGPQDRRGAPRLVGKGCASRHAQRPALGQPSCHSALPPGSGFSPLPGVRVKPRPRCILTPSPPRSPPRATSGPCIHPHPPSLAQPCFLGKPMGNKLTCRLHLSGATGATSLPSARPPGSAPGPSGRVSKGDRSMARVPACHSAPWRPHLSRQQADAESEPQGTWAFSLHRPCPACVGHGTWEDRSSGFPAPAFHVSPWHSFTDV